MPAIKKAMYCVEKMKLHHSGHKHANLLHKKDKALLHQP